MIRPYGTPRDPLRVCLDLNLWIADLLAARHGRTDTATQTLVRAVCRGPSSLGPMQLVISWGMLNRLELVLLREFEPDPEAVKQLTTAIARYAQRGPGGDAPYLVLGGTGVVSLRDEEDAHVLESALAGRAELLITNNFRDFLVPGCTVLVEKQVALVSDRRGGELVVTVPIWAMRWLRQGRIELPGSETPR